MTFSDPMWCTCRLHLQTRKAPRREDPDIVGLFWRCGHHSNRSRVQLRSFRENGNGFWSHERWRVCCGWSLSRKNDSAVHIPRCRLGSVLSPASEDRCENFFPGNPLRRRSRPTRRRMRGNTRTNSSMPRVLIFISSGAKAGMVAVLFPAPRIAADRLNVTLFRCANPNIFPRRGNHQSLDPHQRIGVMKRFAVRKNVGKLFPATLAPNAWRLLGNVPKAGHFGGLHRLGELLGISRDARLRAFQLFSMSFAAQVQILFLCSTMREREARRMPGLNSRIRNRIDRYCLC